MNKLKNILKIIIESNTWNALLKEIKSFLDSPEGTKYSVES